MAGLIISYFLFLAVGFGHFDADILPTSNWPKIFLGLPIMFTSFSYQGVIPSLYQYLGKREKPMKKAIFLGTLIPLLAYIIWELLILGIVPLEGENGLIAARTSGLSAVHPLSQLVGSPVIGKIGQFFAFFALTTSFLGVTLGLTDFLADGFQIEKKGGNKILLALVVFAPPLLVSLTNPGVVLSALGYAGGIGCSLLLGLMPILMVWAGRYRLNLLPSKPLLKGGKIVLGLMVLFVAVELCVEFIYK
jgi:tyrosine-specific transport protein